MSTLMVSGTRSLYAGDILGPGPVLATFAQHAALPLRRAPHRTREREVRLADDLGSLVRHDAHAAQGEIDVTEWESRDVREASVVRVDDAPSLALDRVGAGLVERLAGSDVAFDLPQGQVAERTARADRELPSRAAGGDEGDFRTHQVFAAGEGRQHRDRVGPVRRFSDALATRQDLCVRGERHLARSS